MTETTHTLLDDAANILDAHGIVIDTGKIREAKKQIPNVPLSPRPEVEAIQLMKLALTVFPDSPALGESGEWCWNELYGDEQEHVHAVRAKVTDYITAHEPQSQRDAEHK